MPNKFERCLFYLPTKTALVLSKVMRQVKQTENKSGTEETGRRQNIDVEAIECYVLELEGK